jgi:hypothetical protein
MVSWSPPDTTTVTPELLPPRKVTVPAESMSARARQDELVPTNRRIPLDPDGRVIVVVTLLPLVAITMEVSALGVVRPTVFAYSIRTWIVCPLVNALDAADCAREGDEGAAMSAMVTLPVLLAVVSPTVLVYVWTKV